jgi:hypothetical protein
VRRAGELSLETGEVPALGRERGGRDESRLSRRDPVEGDQAQKPGEHSDEDLLAHGVSRHELVSTILRET